MCVCVCACEGMGPETSEFAFPSALPSYRTVTTARQGFYKWWFHRALVVPIFEQFCISPNSETVSWLAGWQVAVIRLRAVAYPVEGARSASLENAFLGSRHYCCATYAPLLVCASRFPLLYPPRGRK